MEQIETAKSGLEKSFAFEEELKEKEVLLVAIPVKFVEQIRQELYTLRRDPVF